MTGFARANGCLQTAGESIDWAWEIKSVNGKNLDLKLKLPFGYDDLSFTLKSRASEFLTRGNVSACLEINREIKNRTVKIDDELLNKLAEKAIALSEKFAGKVGYPSAAELLSQKGVIEVVLGEYFDNEMEDNMTAPEIIEQDQALPHIHGPQFVDAYAENIVYEIKNANNGTFVVNSSKVVLNNATESSCEISILTGKSHSFDLIYQRDGEDDIVLNITVESF